MNKIIISQLFDVALEINGYSNNIIIGNTKSIEDVITTFTNLLNSLKTNS